MPPGGASSAAELADELECLPRTVYRDLEALQAAGVLERYEAKRPGKDSSRTR